VLCVAVLDADDTFGLVYHHCCRGKALAVAALQVHLVVSVCQRFQLVVITGKMWGRTAVAWTDCVHPQLTLATVGPLACVCVAAGL
jgi:hypothetical protein